MGEFIPPTDGKVTAKSNSDTFVPPTDSVELKKKDKSKPASTPQKSVSETPIGSSGGKGFPKIDTNSVAPGLGVQPKVSVAKKTFRLPTVNDEVEMQRRGITPPPSEILKQTANNTKDLYDLDANGNVIPEKPNKLFAGLKKQDKTKGFYQQGEELVKQNKDIQNGFSEKTTFELEGGKLIPKTTVKDFKTSEGIDKEIENNDLNLDHPYLYYSTFDKENQPKDTFVESNFGENKLADLGINPADFDGFLNKIKTIGGTSYKAEYLDKEAKGLFEGKGTDLTGGYNIQLAKEIQKQRLLNLYMQDINSRDFAKRKLNQEKVNLGKLGADREQLNTQYTLFDSNKVGAFYEKEMPILTQKLKERDAENKKIYDTHKNGDAGFFYGTKQVLNSGWNGFLDRVNQTSSTMLDKIGLDSGADELRLLNEERQVQRPNTRDVGYASGRTTTYDGVDYLVTNDGQIIDKDKKIRVTDLFFKPTYDAIVNKSKSGEEDSVFSFQGSAIQAGGVLGDMIVQVALQRGVGLASGATVKSGSLLSKIPISKSIGSAIIAQSALGYSQGLEQTYKAAIDAGIDEKMAKVLATDAAQRMAGLYAVTAPISPQTKAIEGIFGSEGKELIKKAIAAYTQTGKKGFIETFKQGGKQLSKNAIIFTEEGGKEVFQENIQQGGENYGVNASINRDAGRELLKETISGDEFVNTSILSFGSGGLMTLPGMFSSADKLKTLQQLSQDPIAFEKNLKELVSKGVFANDKADILRKDVKIYSNQAHKIPKNLNKDIAMDVMSDLEDISQLELKKKGIDKSFHEEIDAEIEAKRTGIRDRINFVGLSKKEIATLKETASDELIAEAKEQGKKEFKFDNKQITERANKIYAKQVKENKKKENEQTPPTTEAQPQAEVPQQAEAEKAKSELEYLDDFHKKTLEDEKSYNWQKELANEYFSDKRKYIQGSIDIAKENLKENPDSGFDKETIRVKEEILKELDEQEKTKETPKPQEVSPVEDVVAKSVENIISDEKGNPKTFFHGSENEFTGDFKNNNPNIDGFWFSDSKENANTYGKNVKSVNLDIKNPLVIDAKGKKFTDDIEVEVLASFPNEKPYLTKIALGADEIVYMVKNGKRKNSFIEIVDRDKYDGVVIKNFIDPALSSRSEESQTTVVAFDNKQIKQNEATPETNTPIDGNIQSGASDVGETGTTNQENPIQENLPSSVDGGENKEVIEVEKKSVSLPNLDDIEDFINQTYLKDEQSKTTTDTNSGTKEISPSENPNLPKETSGRKDKQKEIKLDENGFVIVSKKGKTPLSKRQFKGDRKIATDITPSDARSVVLSFFAKGGKIASSYFSKPGELKARNNGINGIATIKAKGIDGIAHDLWQSQENKVLKLDTEAYKGAIEEVVHSHNNIQDIVDSLLKYDEKESQESPVERQENFKVYQELQEEEKASDEEMQKALSVLDQLSNSEIIELANNQEKGFEDFLKDIEKRQVTYDLGPFSEKGTLQDDGSIISEKGDYVSKESVTNVKQVNPEVKPKKVNDKAVSNTPELKEVNEKITKANENLRIAKDALSRKAKLLDKDLVNDNEDIFGERKNKNDNKLFDERVDVNARDKATEKERKAVKDAQNEIKKLTDLKAKIESGEVSSTKDIFNAEVDRIAQKVKDLLPGINDPDLHTQGLSQDKLIDLVASAVKALVGKGIDLHEAITQVVDSLKARFGDIDIDIDAVKERINPKKETESKKETEQKTESSKDLEEFRDSWNKDPSSGEVNQYDSGNTILREHGELRNNQDYEVQKDLARVQIGLKAIEHAKRLFGSQYVEKTLSFIEQANLSPEKKAVAYVLLENEMDARTKEFPDNVSIKKLQDLVRAKSQVFLANSARAIGAGRFRVERFRELAKNGFSEDEFTNAILTSKQIKDKAKIERLIEVSSEDVNNEDERQENSIVDPDLDKLISENVEKQINEIYKKLPTSRKVKADKAISALENIQKKLRNKAYDATIGVPIAIIDSGITIIKNSIKAGVNIADAIELGINHIKSKYGKEWQKEDDFRKDMLDGFESEGVNVKDKKEKVISEEQKAKDLVKKSLIDAGFNREITVRNKNGKEKRNVLDWKKLAGEAGTIDNIRKNVEDVLKGNKYSAEEIKSMKDVLEKEYVRLTADIIEKGLNELQNRNADRKPVNTKSAAKKLAELYNYGLFEKNKDSYEKIINSVLGFNRLDQKAFDEMKQIAKGYAVLMESGLSDTEMKDAINSLSRRQSRLVATLAFSQSDWKFKLAVALSEITNLSTRFKLVNLGNLAENISSGMMARASNNMMQAIVNGISGKKTSNKALRNQSKINAKAKLKGITFEASESYGDTSSLLLNHSAVEDYFNNATTNKMYHALISTYMAKPVLEGADSFNKILITEAKMIRSTIKVLEAKGMKNSEALDYVAKSLTGESMKEALIKAKSLIDKVNAESGKKLLNDSEVSIKSLASDIVKESLVSGGQITENELKAIYNAAYKSAGKDIGHVSNNWVTDQISAKGAQIEKQVVDAIKEKKWDVASGAIINQLIWKNFISTFIGGGTNWFVKGLQKSANPLSLISLRDDAMKLKMAGKLDVTTDEGIKNMEESLYRGMNLRSTGATIMMGAIVTASIFGSLSATGADDEIDKWLKKNMWAKKFFDKMVPDILVLMLAIKNKEYGRYIAKVINVKADFFDDQKNSAKIIENYVKGYADNDERKISKASGDLGAMLGKRFELPAPLRAAKDAKQIYKGLVKGEYDETDYYTSGFLNGFFQGGIVEGLGLRKDQDFKDDEFTKEQEKRKIKSELSKEERVKDKVDNRLSVMERKVKEFEYMKMAQKNKVPYYSPSGIKIDVSKIDFSKGDSSMQKVKKAIKEVKSKYGIKDNK